MEKIRIGFDSNLGLPDNFNDNLQISSCSYACIGDLLQDLKDDKLSLAFLPVGTLLYLKEKYEIIAQATLETINSTSLTSILITSENLTATDLRTAHLGRVNQYCTTSYWAPLKYLMSLSSQKFKPQFTNTEGFQDLLFKVADKTVAAGMLWDIILAENSSTSQKTHHLAALTDLPSPIIVAKRSIDINLKRQITTFQASDKNFYFNGFTEPNLQQINHFIADMQKANEFYGLGL